MPSAAHEAMVEQIVATGQRTPTVAPGPEQLALARRRRRARAGRFVRERVGQIAPGTAAADPK